MQLIINDLVYELAEVEYSLFNSYELIPGMSYKIMEYVTKDSQRIVSFIYKSIFIDGKYYKYHIKN